MNNQQQKARDFIGNLLSNPVLQGYSPLQKEAQVRLFLEQNAAQLFPALSLTRFFPDHSRPKIDYSFINFFHSQGIPQEKMKETLYSIVKKNVEKSGGRFAITVTDPIHVMRKGMSDPDYNLEVEIPEENDTKKSGLSLSDISGLLGKEGRG